MQIRKLTAINIVHCGRCTAIVTQKQCLRYALSTATTTTTTTTIIPG